MPVPRLPGKEPRRVLSLQNVDVRLNGAVASIGGQGVLKGYSHTRDVQGKSPEYVSKMEDQCHRIHPDRRNLDWEQTCSLDVWARSDASKIEEYTGDKNGVVGETIFLECDESPHRRDVARR